MIHSVAIDRNEKPILLFLARKVDYNFSICANSSEEATVRFNSLSIVFFNFRKCLSLEMRNNNGALYR